MLYSYCCRIFVGFFIKPSLNQFSFKINFNEIIQIKIKIKTSLLKKNAVQNCLEKGIRMNLSMFFQV